MIHSSSDFLYMVGDIENGWGLLHLRNLTNLIQQVLAGKEIQTAGRFV